MRMEEPDVDRDQNEDQDDVVVTSSTPDLRDVRLDQLCDAPVGDALATLLRELDAQPLITKTACSNANHDL